MSESRLHTTSEVIDALGGNHAVVALTGRKYTAVCNWHHAKSFPPELYLLMSGALRKRRKSAPAELWRQAKTADARALHV